jgi:hypothetical protein
MLKVGAVYAELLYFVSRELMSTTGMVHQTVNLPRWSIKTDVWLPEPEDAKRRYFVATLHLRKLGLTYTIQRWFHSGCELYIVGLSDCERR